MLRRIKAIAIASEAAILVLSNTTEFPAVGKVDDKQNCPAGVVSPGEKEMASVPVERRRYRRSVFPSNIEYSMKAEANSETFKGVAVDISESGLCIYTSHVLKEGQEIAIISVLPVPSRTATVRWTKRLNEDVSKAGLMFVK